MKYIKFNNWEVAKVINIDTENFTYFLEFITDAWSFDLDYLNKNCKPANLIDILKYNLTKIWLINL